MTLSLYSHPFASYCQKVLIALYENATPFEAVLVDLADPRSRETFYALWPMGKMPVLRDEARARTVVESSIIIEYLHLHYPGPAPMLPSDPERALEVRMWDRFHDLYVMGPMQTIVGDRLRPQDRVDPLGVETARQTLRTAYRMLERELAGRRWACGDGFSLADCAAAPALFYADWVEPFSGGYPLLAAYFQRLLERPSFARVVDEARPYRSFFPRERAAE